MNNNTSNQQSPTPAASILQLLQIVAGDTSVGSDFSQAWVIRDFQAGEDLNGDIENTSNCLYLICQGQVRLWGFDATLGREVSTQLLLAAQTFGGENLFCDQTLPYRAIAISAGCVAQIAIDDLKKWLHSIPNLESDLQLSTYQQQALIFFKTYTEWCSLTSATPEELLPYLIAIKITSGSSLLEATAQTQGRFWLAGGRIDNSLQVGDSWVYPDVTFNDGIAQTDLLVYYLSTEDWESVTATVPENPAAEAESTNSPIVQIPLPVPQSSEQPEDDPDLELENIDVSQGINQPKSSPKLLTKYPFIPQQSGSDSGAACLAMISQHWGKRWGLYTLGNLAQVERMGASLHGLASAADNLGYDVQAVRADFDKLDTYTNPWIAEWQKTNYVVVWQVKGDRLLISDPAIGKRWLSLAEFTDACTGYALILSPTKRFHTLNSSKVSLKRYWDTLRHYRKLLGQIIFASILVQVIGLATPLFSQVVIDQVIPLKDFDTLNIFVISFLSLGIWRTVLIAQRQYILEYIANRIDINLIGHFINHTLQQPLQFFASRPIEDILNRVQENSKIQLFLTRQAVSGTVDTLMVVIYLGLMAYYNWQLTLLVLLWIFFIVIVSLVSSPFLKKASRKIAQESVGQNSSISEMIAGIVTVKTATAEYAVQMHWEQRFQQMLKVRLRGRKLANNLQLIKSGIHHLGSTAILWFGVNLVISQQMSLGKFVAFNLLVSNIAIAVVALLELWDEFPEVQDSVERLEEVLASQPEENFHQTPLPAIPPIRGEVQFENVSFGYNADEDHEILQNISFQVKPQQTIGIIGESGSGKSTLVNLLAGLYRPDTGQILIDGQDISLVSPQSLRSQLGFVPQECFLFSGSVLENITLYSSEFSPEQAIASAQLAEAHNFIEALPLGYDTQIGATGIKLSAGQKQKIAIARALIRNPAILILDEATNALDAESERRFQQNLAQMSQHLTTFIISHRLSSVRHADSILVLNKGVLLEQGTHQELMAKAGFYRHLAQLQ